ncbi:hypothetical protein, partial [Aeromonas australiensis]|uniref:hypothetical protein n=1 Tax=Aeromonas australiensis TaxID=1114880 RepID=UPI001F3E0DA4
DVFGQLSGQCFECVLVHLLTHEGILLKKLLIRGRLHNWIYRLSRPHLFISALPPHCLSQLLAKIFPPAA